MSKKAQGMSMNVIIIAAIALLVLVILAVIFIGRMGTTRTGIEQCKGLCAESVEDCQERYGQYYTQTADPCYDLGATEPNPDLVCCVGV
jgi:hypothetical protein